LLDKQEAFRVLYRTLNFSPLKVGLARLRYNTFLDTQLCDSFLECHRGHLRLDDYYVKVLTLKEPSAQSFPLIFKENRKLDEFKNKFLPSFGEGGGGDGQGKGAGPRRLVRESPQPVTRGTEPEVIDYEMQALKCGQRDYCRSSCDSEPKYSRRQGPAGSCGSYRMVDERFARSQLREE
jgi:hypothetical protein